MARRALAQEECLVKNAKPRTQKDGVSAVVSFRCEVRELVREIATTRLNVSNGFGAGLSEPLPTETTK